MVEVRKNPLPDEIRFGARHVLFVEGKPGSIDRMAMHRFLGTLVRVEGLGPSFHVSSAAQALRPFHPTYYFLIDRDHHDDAAVESSWERFPDPATHNLLIWPRRELENYFIIPEYLLRSDYLTADEASLRAHIVDLCQRRLYLDAVNHVITTCRESLKSTWITATKDLKTCATREGALSLLCGHQNFGEKRDQFARHTSAEALAQRFDDYLTLLTGGGDSLEFGRGRWLELLCGKEILSGLMKGKYFTIRDNNKVLLQSPEKELALATELLSLPDLPQDLERLRTLITARVREAPQK